MAKDRLIINTEQKEDNGGNIISENEVAFGDVDNKVQGIQTFTFDPNTGELSLDGSIILKGVKRIKSDTGNLLLETGGSNGDIIITPNGTGRILLPNLPFSSITDTFTSPLQRGAGNQLTRSAAASFTPTLSAQGLTYSYARQEGVAYRLGNIVFIRIDITFSSTGTAGAGGTQIGNLPTTGVVNKAQRLPILELVNTGLSTADAVNTAFEINGNASFGTIVRKTGSFIPPLTSGGIFIQGIMFTGTL